MACCNHNCREGRDCPNRRPADEAFFITVVIVVLLALFGVVGEIDYRTAVDTAAKPIAKGKVTRL